MNMNLEKIGTIGEKIWAKMKNMSYDKQCWYFWEVLNDDERVCVGKYMSN